MHQILEENDKPKEKPRKIWIALLLSIFIFPLGQLYNGQPKKALLLFLGLTFTTIIFRLTRWVTSFEGALAFTILALIILSYGVIDAIIWAKRQQDYIPQSYNSWLYYILVACLFGSVNFFFSGWEGLKARNFSIPTTSNYPTLQENDRIVADMNIYEKQTPQKGDVVIYLKYDENFGEEIHYIFRVVATPNDKLYVKDNIVFINGQKSDSEIILTKTVSDKFNIHSIDTIQYIKETFPNMQEHMISRCLIPKNIDIANTEEITIPKDKYFLMGDNRDMAYDSRFTGFIDKDKIVGKAAFIYWRNGELVNIKIK